MNTSSSPRPHHSGLSVPDRQDELRTAVRNVIDSNRQEATARKAAVQAAKQREQRQAPMVLLLAALSATLAWAWIARPAAIFGGPPAPAVLSPERAEAQARYALFLERARVDVFRRSHGRYPAKLADAGPVEEGVTYTISGQGFVLERSVNGGVLRLDHAARPESFLGGSLDILQRR
ncbi:MAG: hypothetical protein ABIR59_06995 [Gemmatimonadales bacterium]